jgi:hypothetical protein
VKKAKGENILQANRENCVSWVVHSKFISECEYNFRNTVIFDKNPEK